MCTAFGANSSHARGTVPFQDRTLEIRAAIVRFILILCAPAYSAIAQYGELKMAKHPESAEDMRGSSSTHVANASAFHEVYNQAWAPPSSGLRMASNDEAPVIKLPAPANDLKVHKGVASDGKPFTVYEEADYFANGGK
jgi:hypothetical protein